MFNDIFGKNNLSVEYSSLKNILLKINEMHASSISFAFKFISLEEMNNEIKSLMTREGIPIDTHCLLIYTRKIGIYNNCLSDQLDQKRARMGVYTTLTNCCSARKNIRLIHCKY